MQLQSALDRRTQVEAFLRKHRIGLLTLLFTDVVGSTELKQNMGDQEAVTLLDQHHTAIRQILQSFPDAEEISTAGDSFFIVFAKPSDAVRFALMVQAKLRTWSKETGRPHFDRIGIHVGEVFIEQAEGQGKPKDFYGIQVDTCARVMSLAQADQILMSRFAFDNARQILKGQAIGGLGPLSWLSHGRYLLKGMEEPTEICEVGEISAAPLSPPADSEKAQRCVSMTEKLGLGWRLALVVMSALLAVGAIIFLLVRPEPVTLAANVEIHFQRAEERGVSHSLTERDVPLRTGDRIQFHALVNKPAHLCVVSVDPQGNVAVLYPPANQTAASLTALAVPAQPDEWLPLTEPSGPETIFLIADSKPIHTQRVTDTIKTALTQMGQLPRVEQTSLMLLDTKGFRLLRDQARCFGQPEISDPGPLAQLPIALSREYRLVSGICFPHTPAKSGSTP